MADFFITLYTDASVRPHVKETQVAWRGKCSAGGMEGHRKLPWDPHVARAEMDAIFYGIDDALRRFPNLEGFFINSDNLQCVHSFWTFRHPKIPADLAGSHERILKMIGERWIRTKHVKAHTGKDDIRSWMNARVDGLTRK